MTLLIVAALGSVLVNRSNLQPPDLSTPGGLVTAFVRAVQAGQADQAWNLVGPQAVASFPGPGPPAFAKEDFRRQVQDSRRQSSSRVRIVSVSQSGDTASVQLEVTSNSGNLLSGASSNLVSVSLRRDGASWRITSDPSPWQFQ